MKLERPIRTCVSPAIHANLLFAAGLRVIFMRKRLRVIYETPLPVFRNPPA